MKSWNCVKATWLLPLLVVACTSPIKTNYLSADSASGNTISNETVLLNSSTPRLESRQGVVLTDNDDAFESKLAMVARAQKSIDLAYYIFHDDFSSSTLSQALIEAAQRGVHVRMLLDYFTNYERLDYLSMLEEYGNQGAGSLEVRLYNRPTKNIIKDAVFLTMGCGELNPEPDLSACGDAKFTEIDRLFEEEGPKTSAPYDYQNLSNFNSGGSGVFLSGLYGKYPEVSVLAVLEGQNIDLAAFKSKDQAPKKKKKIEGKDIDRALAAGRVFWQARAGNPKRFQQLVARFKLEMAFALYGEKLHPLYDALTAYLPVERRERSQEVLRDWDYITEFTHHKLLLVDDREFQLGGRNIEDSYHVSPTPLVEKYLFMDTDVHVELRAEEPAMGRAFERIWNFTPMVAPLANVREHAPNDFLVAHRRAKAVCKELHPTTDDPEYRACYGREFSATGDLYRRLTKHYEDMRMKADTFRKEYRPPSSTERWPRFAVDPTAEVYYVENLPFERPKPGTVPTRSYGARNGLEGESGKYIHNLWLAAMRNACNLASAENPQRIIFHNAYLFMPSNMLHTVGRMFDGQIDCRHVHLTVVTNSPETTDLNVINLAARYSAKALANYYLTHRDPKRAATFTYYEYASQSKETGKADRSLHSKVMVFGPDIYIGSANADVRSYMMDTNNGVFIRSAPNLVSAYSAWVDELSADPHRITNKTGYLAETTVEELLAKDTAFITARLKRAAGPELEAKVSIEDLSERLSRILKAINELTTEILKERKPDGEAQRKFNALFKVL